jgi:hypothetical protein
MCFRRGHAEFRRAPYRHHCSADETMNPTRFSLIDILYPQPFPGNAKREAATRTVLQPEIDRYEQADLERRASYPVDGALSQPRFADAGTQGSGT